MATNQLPSGSTIPGQPDDIPRSVAWAQYFARLKAAQDASKRTRALSATPLLRFVGDDHTGFAKGLLFDMPTDLVDAGIHLPRTASRVLALAPTLQTTLVNQLPQGSGVRRLWNGLPEHPLNTLNRWITARDSGDKVLAQVIPGESVMAGALDQLKTKVDDYRARARAALDKNGPDWPALRGQAVGALLPIAGEAALTTRAAKAGEELSALQRAQAANTARNLRPAENVHPDITTMREISHGIDTLWRMLGLDDEAANRDQPRK